MSIFLRKWEKLDIEKIKKNLFVIGELSGECFCCHNVGVPLRSVRCPECNAEFKYIAFRRKIDSHTIEKFVAGFPGAAFIDFDDFKRAVGKTHARKLLDM